jgi:glycosyltransferase involved in cell wall biosynthesis
MCVVVSTRNNAKYNRYLYNIKSLLNQNYTNYRVIILDDASEDRTGLLLKRFLRQNRIGEDKVLVI